MTQLPTGASFTADEMAALVPIVAQHIGPGKRVQWQQVLAAAVASPPLAGGNPVRLGGVTAERLRLNFVSWRRRSARAGAPLGRSLGGLAEGKHHKRCKTETNEVLGEELEREDE